MAMQTRARSSTGTLHDGDTSARRSSWWEGSSALGIAISLAMVPFGCGEDEPSGPSASESGLTPATAGSAGSSGQAGAGPSAPNAPGGSAGGSTNEEGPLPTGIDTGSGGGDGSSSASAADAGDVDGAAAADAGAAPGEADPSGFNPCPTDGSPCRIMPLGDSITDGLVGNAPGSTGLSVGGYRVELFRQAVADGHAITFVGRNQNGPDNVDGQPFPRNHEGYSGAMISTGMNQLANRIDAALAANPPDIVLLHIGTNNLYTGLAAEVPAQLASVIDQITDGAPDALVVVAQITPLAPSFAGNGVDAYNALIPGILQERIDAGKHLLLVDMNSAFRAANANVTALVGDTIHPNATGYGIMAQTWYAGIESFLP